LRGDIAEDFARLPPPFLDILLRRGDARLGVPEVSVRQGLADVILTHPEWTQLDRRARTQRLRLPPGTPPL